MSMYQNRWKLTAVLAVSTYASLAATQAHATVIAEDLFDYETGSLAGNGAATDPGWAGAWTGDGSVTSPGLSHAPLPDTSDTTNKATLSGTAGTDDAVRTLASPFTEETLWFSFLGHRTSGDPSRLAFLGVKDVSGSSAVYVGQNEQGEWTVLDAGNTHSDAAINSLNETLDFGTLAFAVVRIQFNADGDDEVVDLFLNPDATGPQSAKYTATINTDITTALSQVRMFAGSGDANAVTVDYDELRLGTEYADVVVPEPAASALLSAGVLTLLSRRWRRA